MRLPLVKCALIGLCVVSRHADGQSIPPLPYHDSHLAVDIRVRDLVSRMTLQEKFWQLFMIPGNLDNPGNDYSHGMFGLQVTGGAGGARQDAERIDSMQRFFVEQTRLGIPIIPFEEAVHGLRRPGATVFPQAIGLAATWDTALVIRVSTVIARETASRGIRQVLSPVINIANDVRWGRVEETYGEDPWLTSRMAAPFIAPMESAGIVATPKHFIANVGEGGRDSYPIDWDRRLLDELFFPPFKTAVIQAHARSIMSAYNSVDGVPASQNRWLLTDKLRGEWSFTGFVISDAAATGGATVLHMTEPNTAAATRDALDAGLDVIFQSSYPEYRPYWAAFQRGLIADSVVDRAVGRVLRTKFELGLFEHPYVDPDSAAFWNRNPAHRDLALDAARESIVLLKNDNGVLPLSHGKSIAVIGGDAATARFGGYNADGADTVSILDGIRRAAGEHTTIRFAAGPGRVTPEYSVVPAENLQLHGEYFDNNTLSAPARLEREDRQINFGWTLNSPGRGIPFDWYSIRWTGTIIAVAGLRHLGIEANDGYRLYIDNKLVIDDWKKQSYAARMVPVHFQAGSRHALRLEYFESTGNARVKLIWDAGVPDTWKRDISDAVTAAHRSDVAIVVAGIEEGEFRDRSILSLPGHQEELIRAVAGTGKPTIVVLIGGSAITASNWLDSVSAVVDAWYPGEQGGRAVADVLFGDYNPAGRLPITFPIAEGQLPLVYNHRPTGRGDDYLDRTGQPLFPFGFGLSYSGFSYSNLVIDSARAANDSVTIRCSVRNISKIAGDEVVQLYLRDLIATTARPVIQLEGFQRVHLAPDEARDVSFTLGPEQLQMIGIDGHWVVEPGEFRLLIGASSKDIRLRGTFTIP